jgi:hypothetical protein
MASGTRRFMGARASLDQPPTRLIATVLGSTFKRRATSVAGKTSRRTVDARARRIGLHVRAICCNLARKSCPLSVSSPSGDRCVAEEAWLTIVFDYVDDGVKPPLDVCYLGRQLRDATHKLADCVRQQSVEVRGVRSDSDLVRDHAQPVESSVHLCDSHN